jgi:gelsolin
LDLANVQPVLYRISDACGELVFEIVHHPSKSSLSSEDAFLLDLSAESSHPAVFVWIGKTASLNEKRMALQYAQQFLHDKKVRMQVNNFRVTIPIIKMLEGEETPEFLELI